jgi:hypothetical protein
MKQTLIQYRVKPGRAAENEGLIRAVFEELRAAAPDGVRYAAFRLEDGLSFAHLVSVESAEARDRLRGLAAFKAFAANARDRCDVEPSSQPLLVVGSYRLV